MTHWALYHLFVWTARIGVLVAACLTVQHVLVDELGYRMEFRPMLIVALMMIVTVRIWMPWSKGEKNVSREMD